MIYYRAKLRMFFVSENRKMINRRISLKILPAVVVGIVFLVEGLCLPAHSKNIILEGTIEFNK